MDLSSPADEFAVAQAIGSMLDGLTWLHAHGVAHGSVDANALTDGPTGGRLSFAGACGVTTASAEDDVYAASALAYWLLVAEPPGSVALDDPRLEHYASPAVVRAIRAGLHREPAKRPTAALLATMVRGEFLPPVSVTQIQEPLFARLRTALLVSVQTQTARVAAGVGGALAVAAVIGALASADQPGPTPLAVSSLPEEPVAAQVLSASVTRALRPTTTAAPVVVTVTAPEVPASTGTTRPDPPPPPAVLVSAAVPADEPRPTITVTPTPPPPTTTIAPTPVPTTASTSTIRVTTTRPTTTTTAKPGKGKGPKADE
ncbi:MAG: hypothetical protein ABIQ73_07585 [Acidimicrobiales bacterium]